MNNIKKLSIVLSLIIIGLLFFYTLILKNPLQNDNSQKVDNSESPGLPSLSSAVLDKTPDAIRTVYLSINSHKSKDAYNTIREATPKVDGVIARSNISGTKDQDYSGTIELSIPDDKINQMFDTLNNLNATIQSERTSTQDVASQRIDLQVRLKSAQDLESKYLDVLKTAKSVDDVIAVTDKLTAVRQNIEALKQQNIVLDNNIHHINIQITLNLSPIVLRENNEWKPLNDIKRAAQSLLATMQWLVALSIWVFVYLLPLSIIFSGLYFIFNRLYCRKL